MIRRIILVLIFLIVLSAKKFAFSCDWVERFRLNSSIQKDFLKGKDSTDEMELGKIWADLKISIVENWNYFLYPDFEYKFDDKEGKTKFRRDYFTVNFENFYIGVGKQPVMWGVGRGRNPTNYLMQLKLFDKQKEPELALEGIHSIILDYSPGDYTIEAVKGKDEIDGKTAYSFRLKTFLWNTDISFSLLEKDKLSKIGGDFERDICGLFGFYGESSGKNRENWEYLIGLDKTITIFNKSNANLEYYHLNSKDSKQKEIDFQIALYPTEELSVISLLSYDIDKKVNLWTERIGYYVGKIEFVLLSTFKFEYDEERAVTLKVISNIF